MAYLFQPDFSALSDAPIRAFAVRVKLYILGIPYMILCLVKNRLLWASLIFCRKLADRWTLRMYISACLLWHANGRLPLKEQYSLSRRNGNQIWQHPKALLRSRVPPNEIYPLCQIRIGTPTIPSKKPLHASAVASCSLQRSCSKLSKLLLTNLLNYLNLTNETYLL